ncbi:hypothetical protein T440DRAFT_389195 [Plenodomus tracheiphilus IPT5]|uniref:Mid2 domain-containing protein n=1 Tax=Plenodomus tracheiphilus IPT5 TaxID=1408161 RepID=A0A6A7BEY4_9PLEO|nr:hypothetical protein T440DRAFT_389195 [Plenodomus tracheiphilus IPT5]
MASPTLPTVPLPTQTDIDDDDDDDDLSSTTLSLASATTVPEQSQPPSAPVVSTTAVATPETSLPGPPPTVASPTGVVPSSSVSGLADSSPSGGVQDTVIPGNASASDDQGLSSGATAGVVVGVVLVVMLMVVGGWFFIRRRRSRVRKTRTASGETALRDHAADEESANKSEVYAYQAPGAVELGDGKDAGNSDGQRSELASPAVPVEIVGDRQLAVELQGSEVPLRTEKM